MIIKAIVPTRNSEEFLDYTLSSIKEADEIIVCDQGSTDNTLAIAQAHGATIFHQELRFEEGEARCRNESMQFLNGATHFMQIDADEIVTMGWRLMFEDLIKSRDPGCIKVPYWQLLGTASWMQAGNPIESRRVLYRMAPKVAWTVQGTGENYHCGMEYDLPIMDCPEVNYIHLGYTQTNLRDRYVRNVLRGDLTNDVYLRAEYIERMQADPFQFLPNVEPTSKQLYSPELDKIQELHAKTRFVYTVRQGAHSKITNITYGPIPVN